MDIHTNKLFKVIGILVILLINFPSNCLYVKTISHYLCSCFLISPLWCTKAAFTLVHLHHEYGDFCIRIWLLFTLIHENAYPKRIKMNTDTKVDTNENE